MQKLENIYPVNIQDLFSDDDKCLSLLATIKWQNGFTCKKCGHDNSCPGKKPHARRCTRCKHEESATANTIFHNIKFPISKAFYIASEVCDKQAKISSYDFARKLELRQMTCWKFKEKILKAFTANADKTDLEGLAKIILS